MGRRSLDMAPLGADGLPARRPFHMGLGGGAALGGYAGKRQQLL